METIVLFLLFSPVYIPLVIALAVFFNAEKNNKASKTLALVLLNISFLFFGLYFFFSGNYAFYSTILLPNVLSLLLIYPGIYIYVKQIIQPDYAGKKIWLHLSPVFLMAFECAVYYFMLSRQEQILFIKEYRYNPTWDNAALSLIFILRIINLLILFFQIFFYGIKTILLLRKYSSTILNMFSNTEAISLNSIKVLNLALFISSIACIAFYSINPVKVFGNYIALIIPLVVISVTIWLFGIVGLRQKMLPESFSLSVSQPKEVLMPEINNDLYEKIISYFNEDEPYLKYDLKIDDLVYSIGSNRTHLSNAINRYSGKNFNRFVNDYRIEYAKRYIDQNKENCSKEDVAEKSGFGSVRSFERNFKETIGENYNQYLLSHN